MSCQLSCGLWKWIMPAIRSFDSAHGGSGRPWPSDRFRYLVSSGVRRAARSGTGLSRVLEFVEPAARGLRDSARGSGRTRLAGAPRRERDEMPIARRMRCERETGRDRSGSPFAFRRRACRASTGVFFIQTTRRPAQMHLIINSSLRAMWPSNILFCPENGRRTRGRQAISADFFSFTVVSLAV